MSSLHYMVALAVPPPHRDKLAEAQDRLRPVGWKITIGPHVTLVPPGTAKMGVAQAARAFKAVSEGSSALTLRYPDLGLFRRRGLATLFMKPVATDQLYELQRFLGIMAASWQDVSRSLRRPFVPHVTLVNRLPEDQADMALDQLRYLVPTEIEFGKPQLFAKRVNDDHWLQIA